VEQDAKKAAVSLARKCTSGLSPSARKKALDARAPKPPTSHPVVRQTTSQNTTGLETSKLLLQISYEIPTMVVQLSILAIQNEVYHHPQNTQPTQRKYPFPD